MLAKFRKIIAAVTAAALLPALPFISHVLPETTAQAETTTVWRAADTANTTWSLSLTDKINGYANVENGTLTTTIVADDTTNLYETEPEVETAFNSAQFKSAEPTTSVDATNPNIMGIIAQAGNASNYLFKADVKYTLHYTISGNWENKVTNTPNGSYVNASIWQGSSRVQDNNWINQNTVSTSPEQATEKTCEFTPTVDGYAQFIFELRRVKAGGTMTVSDIYVTTDTEMYTVTFNSNGGSSVPSQQVISGKNAAEPDPPTRDGCIFKGWKLGDADYTFTEQVTSDIELVAQWESITGDTLAEEKIELTDKNIYLFTIDNTTKTFKFSKDVTSDSTYNVLTDGAYNADASLPLNHYVMIDLGEEYPISTIKAYQNDITATGTNGNFVAVLDNCAGKDSEFVKADLKNLIRTREADNPLTTENDTNCFTYSQLTSEKHNMGMLRYIILYNGGNYPMNMSEIEIYQDKTVKNPYLSVNNFYSSNMVLQRGKNHVIKGYSATGESVSVTMTQDGVGGKTQTVNATPDENGNWTAELEPMEAGTTPYTITVSDGTDAADVTLTDVLVGDVFLASGQSNMAYDAPKSATQHTTQYDNTGGPDGSLYYKKGMYELQQALANENIRMFKMRDDGQAESGLITENVPVWIDWCKSSDTMTETKSDGTTTNITHENILALSSLAAFFADKVQEEEGIPVGVIQASRGGSAIDIWSEGGRLYNNHIAPLKGLNIAGILWYQGCANSNATGFKTYHDDFEALIKKYREIFNDPALPFLYVQLAPYKNSTPEYESAGSQRFQVMREIQREMLNDTDVNTNLYMAVSLDTTQDSHHDENGNIVNQSLIHPLGKDTLGKRMANAYLGMKNDDNRVINGPLVDKATVSGNTITVTFKEGTADGLQVLNPDYTYQHKGETGWQSKTTELEEFKIAGADGVYHDATATIVGNTIEVSSDEVTAPMYVSYAYSELPKNPNLANSDNLPASPFNIGINGTAAPVAPAETEPSTEPDPPDEPEEPDAPVFTTAPDDTIPRGVEKAIADIEIPQDKSMQFEDGDTVAVIGDSITHFNYYVSLLEEMYAVKKPEADIKFYNMGIGGNTAARGLAIIDKEFEVAEKAGVEPNKAIIMYGMNDSGLTNGQTEEDNIEIYKTKMTEFIQAVRDKGITDITLMSTSPYDHNLVINGKGDDDHKYKRRVMLEYVKWLKEYTAEHDDCHFIDLTTPMYALLDAYQEGDNTRTFINYKDRIHPLDLGSFVMAYIIAKSQGLDGKLVRTEITVSGDSAAVNSGTAKDLSISNGDVEFTYTPSKHTLALSNEYFEANRIVPFTKEFNQEILKVNGLEAGYYDIDMDGFTAGPYTAEELAEGINMAVIPNSPIAKRADKIYSDLSASFYVVKEELRNLRSLEQEVIKRAQAMPEETPNRDKLINLDDEAVMQYVEAATDLTGRNRYIENKENETELIKKFMDLLAKVREDANEAPESINITVTSHKPKGSEVVIFADGFTNRNSSYDESKWMLADLAPTGATSESAGTTSYDYTEGCSGVGAAKITIGINNYKNGYTLTNGPKGDVDYKYNRPRVIPGQKLHVSAAVKTEDVRDTDLAEMTVEFYKEDNTTSVANSKVTVPDPKKGTHDWITIEQDIIVPEEASYMRIDVYGRGMSDDTKQGTVWFDDVKVTSSLQNADFEDASNGAATAWTTADIANPVPENYDADLMTFKSNWTHGGDSNSVKSEYDTTNAVTGGKSLKFVSTVSDDSADRSYYHTGTNYIRLKPNTNYKITMKAKVDNYQLLDNFSQAKPAGLTYQAILYKEANGAADTTQSYKLTESYLPVTGSTTEAKTADWADYSMILTTPEAEAGQTYEYLRSNVMMRFASGTAWVDSITVEECDAEGNVASQDNIDTENKVSGKQSLIVRGGSGVTYSSEPIIVSGTQKYLLSAYAKKDAAAEGKISIETYNSKKESLGSTNISVTSADFAKVQQEVTIPEGAVYAVIKLYAKDGNMNVDAVGLSKLTGERDKAYTYTESEPVQPPDPDQPDPTEYGIKYTDENNSEGAVVTAPEAGTCHVVLAAYAGGALTSVEVKEVKFEAAGEQTVTAENFTSEGADTVKAMLWKSLEDMKPLCGTDIQTK